MGISFDNERPIYLQLVEIIEVNIISGKISSGERLPSVRDFAAQYRVNPNTMQKALTELENKMLIYTERTNGKFVTEDKVLIDSLKKDVAKEKVNIFLSDMKTIGFSKDEIIYYLQDQEGK